MKRRSNVHFWVVARRCGVDYGIVTFLVPLKAIIVDVKQSILRSNSVR
jgi:hypothetical protein